MSAENTKHTDLYSVGDETESISTQGLLPMISRSPFESPEKSLHTVHVPVDVLVLATFGCFFAFSPPATSPQVRFLTSDSSFASPAPSRISSRIPVFLSVRPCPFEWQFRTAHLSTSPFPTRAEISAVDSNPGDRS